MSPLPPRIPYIHRLRNFSIPKTRILVSLNLVIQCRHHQHIPLLTGTMSFVTICPVQMPHWASIWMYIITHTLSKWLVSLHPSLAGHDSWKRKAVWNIMCELKSLNFRDSDSLIIPSPLYFGILPTQLCLILACLPALSFSLCSFLFFLVWAWALVVNLSPLKGMTFTQVIYPVYFKTSLWHDWEHMYVSFLFHWFHFQSLSGHINLPISVSNSKWHVQRILYPSKIPIQSLVY